jgi:hypothetical protein
MRNLGLRSVSNLQIAGANIYAVALDLDEKTIYATSDHRNADADVEIDIWKIDIGTNILVEVRVPC